MGGPTREPEPPTHLLLVVLCHTASIAGDLDEAATVEPRCSLLLNEAGMHRRPPFPTARRFGGLGLSGTVAESVVGKPPT
ncbi:hypothetical protein CIHG_01094 [Coccidioides immitis H538.4]|uniref:Secreted protein n=2 Tax=Coccidioides immitis TaxID=5501 RepID=A0A0J8QQM1_COCIT|nr:hypothetical protein CISG_00711 [Coccidioides immitis RMSCC 3703]KMU83312.1 hypothetical protein CIHG_01094 [Coccidioides immitis H538.4]